MNAPLPLVTDPDGLRRGESVSQGQLVGGITALLGYLLLGLFLIWRAAYWNADTYRLSD